MSGDETMSEIVRDTTRGIVDSVQESAEAGFAAATWRALVKAGLHLIGLDEDRGGSGGSWLDAHAAVQATAGRAAAVPLAEALFGIVPALAELEIDLADIDAAAVAAASFGAASALTASHGADGWTVDGRVLRVPFARRASSAIVVAPLPDVSGGGLVALCPLAAAATIPGTNIAGEPRDDVTFSSTAVQAATVAGPEAVARLYRLAALARVVQIAGAAEEVLAITIGYASERQQFGRPIARFQAVAHRIAVMAGEVTVASAAAAAAVGAIGTAEEPFAAAAAKARAGASASLIAGSAHQVFGALGFTQEHPLHRLTRRLWSWRGEVGSAEHWQRQLGGQVLAAGAEGLWPLLSGTGLADQQPQVVRQ
jgi:acyl-CoA dehydrogenase